LGIKEKETRLNLHEHDDDNDDDIFKIRTIKYILCYFCLGKFHPRTGHEDPVGE